MNMDDQRYDYHVQGLEDQVAYPFDISGPVRQEYAEYSSQCYAYEYLPVEGYADAPAFS